MEESEASQSPKRPRRTKRSSRPFGGKRRLYDVVTVQVSNTQLKQDFNAQGHDLTIGTAVVVETSKGATLGRVCSEVNRRVLSSGGIKRVLRVADEGDTVTGDRNRGRQRDAALFALQRIRARKLPMKLIRAEYLHDGSKAVFFFSADGRIDFRDLVKDLASRLRTRIEMRQVGVRDGARIVGGIGTCGRELCCSTFLQGFAPVSIRMAKDQGLTLNPKKVSGMCGRLMCCLVYEQQVYRKAKANMPRIGQAVSTAMGDGIVRSIDVIAGTLAVRLDDGSTETFPRQAVLLEKLVVPPHAKSARGKNSDVPAAPGDGLRHALESATEGEDYLWSGAEHPKPKADQPAPRARRRRRRAKSGGAPVNGPQGAQSARRSDRSRNATTARDAKAGQGDGKGAPAPRRRRRARAAAAADGKSGGAPKGRGANEGGGEKVTASSPAKKNDGAVEAGAKPRRRRRRRRSGRGPSKAPPKSDG